jgi:hypothetical protein
LYSESHRDNHARMIALYKYPIAGTGVNYVWMSWKERESERGREIVCRWRSSVNEKLFSDEYNMECNQACLSEQRDNKEESIHKI